MIKRTGPANPLKGIAAKLDREVRIALEKSGDILEKESKHRVPVDTGRLQRSINFIVVPITNGLRLIFGSGVKGGRQVPYAKYVEYGNKYWPGVPFLRSSISDKKLKIERLITSAIRKAFK